MASSDPIQQLLDAGAIPASPFDEASRYRGVPLALWQPPDGRPAVAHVRRRFLPALRDLPIAASTEIAAGDRPDLLAARTLGDPLAYWRIADANAVADPFDLTDTPGARVQIPAPASR